MARSTRENGKVLAALAIGAAIVGVNFMRNRKTLRPISDDLADRAREGIDDVRRDWSERVREATGGAEDLKGKTFWAAAGLVVASTLISACVDNAKKQSERKAEEPKGPTPEERLAAFNERFQHFRRDPRLKRGSILPNAEVSQNPYTVSDRTTATTFAYAPGRGDIYDPAGFSFSYGRTPDEIAEVMEGRSLGSGRIQGKVEYLMSHENGFERIYVLKKIVRITGSTGQAEPYTLSDDEVARIADLFATVMQPSRDGDKEFPTFAVYDRDGGP